MAVTVSLPSIHELFPDHLLPPPTHSFPPTTSTRYSFDVLRSDPASSSLTHIASSDSLPYQPLRRECTPLSSEDDEEGAKKHVCRTCHKRFNRPSSLRIHINTHTGATPFRCPFPGCRREFNVNSNMRRHYRNHTSSSAAELFPSASSSRQISSSSLHVSPRPYLIQKHHPAVNRSEYVWHPSSSSTLSDDEDQEEPRYTADSAMSVKHGYRSTLEELSEEKEYVRRRISDIRTTRDGER